MPTSSGVVVLDNGAGLIKAGHGGDRDPTIVVPNCLAKSTSKTSSNNKALIADELLSPTADLTSSALRRPFDRGFLINPDLQRPVWLRLLSLLRADPTSSSLLLTEPLFNPPSLQRSTDELVFEDLGFRSLYVADSPSLVHVYEASRRRGPQQANEKCSLVVDCGFSFAHAAPVVENFTLNYGVKRMDLGGKALTNYLKELVSYRSINVMDETFIVDDAKEKLCFVSLDVERDLRLARKTGKDNPFKCTYVLPDGITHTKGYVKDMEEAQRYLSLRNGGWNMQPAVDGEEDSQKSEDKRRIGLTTNEFILTNERFLVPEMIFRPADLGMNQAGLAECIVRSVHSCHPHLHPVLFESIVLTGGSTLFPGFAERLEMELRPLIRDDYKVKITTQEEYGVSPNFLLLNSLSCFVTHPSCCSVLLKVCGEVDLFWHRALILSPCASQNRSMKSLDQFVVDVVSSTDSPNVKTIVCFHTYQLIFKCFHWHQVKARSVINAKGMEATTITQRCGLLLIYANTP